MGRRAFLKRFGGGLVIAVSLLDFDTLEAAVLQEYPSDLNAYLSIEQNGRVYCYTGKIEMGQGVITSLAQMIAEELDVSLSSVDMVMGDTDLCPYDRGTWGSLTTRMFGPALRSAGAEARAILLEMASEKMKVPVSGLSVNEGVVFETKNKQNNVSYADLEKGARIVKSLKEKPLLKDPKDFKIIGKSYLKLDSPEKVMGIAKYAGDIRIPGMVYAKILRPPSHAAKRTKVDVSAVQGVNGIE